MTQQPTEAWKIYLDTVEKMNEARTALRGRRVKYVGIGGNYDGPTGIIRDMGAGGLRIKWPAGTYMGATFTHPDDVRFI